MEVTSSIEGARVENNKFCVSVHYRNVAEKVRLRATETFILYYVYLFIFPFFVGREMDEITASDILLFLLGCIRFRSRLLQGSSSEFT